MNKKSTMVPRNKKYWRTAKNLVSEYLKTSTIHGVKYIAEKDRSWIEKAWWVLVICVSILCCGKLIMDAWNTNPIIISFTDKPTPIWQLPFPVVTLCPVSFVSYRFFNISDFAYRFRHQQIFPEDLTEEE
jgi:acid-sensing ion channel, other